MLQADSSAGMAGLIQTDRPYLEPTDPTRSRAHYRRSTGPRRPSEDVQSLLIVIVDGSPHQIPQVRRFLPFVEHDRSRGGEKLLRLNVQGGAGCPIDIHAKHRCRYLLSSRGLSCSLGAIDQDAAHCGHALAQFRIDYSRSVFGHAPSLYFAMSEVYDSPCSKSMFRYSVAAERMSTASRDRTREARARGRRLVDSLHWLRARRLRLNIPFVGGRQSWVRGPGARSDD